MQQRLAEHGVRVAIDAEQILKDYESDELVYARILALGTKFLTKEDAERIIGEVKKEKEALPTSKVLEVEVKRSSDYNPLAAEYSSDVKIFHTRDVTGKSRTTGEVDDFVSYFRSRYEKLAKLLHGPSRHAYMDLGDAKRHQGQYVKAICLVSKIDKTKKGNLLLEVEDLTGKFKVLIMAPGGDKRREKAAEKGQMIVLDDVIAVIGKVAEAFLIAEDIEWPDMPITKERKLSENDVATIYLSDIHFGSKYFLDKWFERMVEWLNGRGEQKELAGKVKYIVVAGDIVDGIGIYPNQEKELLIKDAVKQYSMFDDFVNRLPDHMEVIVAPGNHDAVRRGEPMPAIGKDLITSDVISVGNPSAVSIEGIKHLIYHGTSMDSLIATLPSRPGNEISYKHPERVMLEYLKRRHLSTIYGGNPIVPEKVDYMVIEEEPDVLHCGHVHKNGYMLYRGTVLINSGTFQDRTEFQVKQGHIPTPALVPIYEMKTGKLRTLDFKTE
jgi:DNA polymerase II small subunit